MTAAALQTLAITKSFGSLLVAGGIDFVLEAGARHALIGPNGAGKTTFLNLLTGLTSPASGSVLLGGVDITALPVHRRVRQGLARTFQINTLLREATVLENVQLAIVEHWHAGARLFGGAALQRRAAAVAFDILERLRLDAYASECVGTLAYGRQRLVEVAIALALQPRVLLLDEPAAGVPPGESHLMLDLLSALPRDISILVIEHDMKLVFRFAERITVLVGGRILTEGTPAEIAADQRVREVYLGTRHG